MFIDERQIRIASGDGGDGIVSWIREKRIPFGGPGGGDGGRGGDVVLVADPQLTTFGDMEDVRHARAAHGQPGGRNKRAGAAAPDRILHVPVGTTVYDADSGEKLVDLADAGMRWIAAKGGKGGRGNARFATSIDQAPRHAVRPLNREVGHRPGAAGARGRAVRDVAHRVEAGRRFVVDRPCLVPVGLRGVIADEEDLRRRREPRVGEAHGLAHRAACMGIGPDLDPPPLEEERRDVGVTRAPK